MVLKGIYTLAKIVTSIHKTFYELLKLVLTPTARGPYYKGDNNIPSELFEVKTLLLLKLGKASVSRT
jgi:hypothetical protein